MTNPTPMGDHLNGGDGDEFAGEYYIDPVSVRNAVSSRSMFNIIHNRTVVKVDCIVLKRDPLETKSLNGAFS